MFFLAVRLYLIEILHQTTTSSCVSLFILCCILSKFYIKPQLRVRTLRRNRSCILSKFYIKPQQRLQDANIENVVSYRNSTSNHNHHDTVEYQFKVVSYRNSTSNHNCRTVDLPGEVLYLIEILHQTTTRLLAMRWRTWLYLIEILHQTTTTVALGLGGGALYLIEILHQTTTEFLHL